MPLAEIWRLGRPALVGTIVMSRMFTKTGLLALVVALSALGNVASAQGQGCNDTMSAEEAFRALESGEAASDDARCEELIKGDIKTCLKLFFPKDCTGKAKKWVDSWGMLKLRNTGNASSEGAAKALRRLQPSFREWQVPFAKSPTDYWGQYYHNGWIAQKRQ